MRASLNRPVANSARSAAAAFSSEKLSPTRNGSTENTLPGSVRCRPSTRMSRIWKGSIANAARGVAAPARITQAATGRIRLGKSEDIRCFLPAQEAGQVVGKGERHQQQDREDPAIPQPRLPRRRDRTTGRTLEEIIQQPSPIEHRERPQG